jgi:hypothetical protein
MSRAVARPWLVGSASPLRPIRGLKYTLACEAKMTKSGTFIDSYGVGDYCSNGAVLTFRAF